MQLVIQRLRVQILPLALGDREKDEKLFFNVVREILVVHSLLKGAMLMPLLLESSVMDMVVPMQVSV
jgi:hypothetical protein